MHRLPDFYKYLLKIHTVISVIESLISPWHVPFSDTVYSALHVPR